jgi:hypothetical protein
MSGIDQLLALAREYARAEDVELTTVSWRVFGDTKKLGALESGSDIQVKRYEAAITWFDKNWPAEAAWPSAVARPSADIPDLQTEVVG